MIDTPIEIQELIESLKTLKKDFLEAVPCCIPLEEVEMHTYIQNVAVVVDNYIETLPTSEGILDEVKTQLEKVTLDMKILLESARADDTLKYLEAYNVAIKKNQGKPNSMENIKYKTNVRNSFMKVFNTFAENMEIFKAEYEKLKNNSQG